MERNMDFITIELIHGKNAPVQSCSEFLVLYGLKGKTAVISGKRRYELETGGLLAIPPFTHYNFHCGQKSGLAILRISQELLQVADMNGHLARTKCYVVDDSSGIHGGYDHIRVHFARLFQAYFQNSAQKHIQLFAEASQLLSILMTYFTVPGVGSLGSVSPKDPAALDRYDRIMTYIHEHWRENISIEQLAQREYISTGHLSRSFKAYTGVTFTEYLTELRLQNAAHDLQNDGDTITQIALANGFKNVNSFIKQFKLRYGSTPQKYRKSVGKGFPKIEQTELKTLEDAVNGLLKYTTFNEQITAMPPPPMESRQVIVSASTNGQGLRHTWRRLLNAGYAGNILLGEIQHRIYQAQQEVGFEYIRFHGILDDDMYVYHEDKNGNPYLECSRVDLLLDFILSAGLKPYIEFSYMPKLLAKKAEDTFDRAIHISVFSDEAKWKFLVKELLCHCIERYGRAQVLEWRFSTLGCNCVSTGIITQEDYLCIYQATYECVKEVDQRLVFGGPGGHSSSIWDNRCIHDFLEYTVSENCVPDFICTECFPYRTVGQEADFWQFWVSQSSAPSVLSTDEHYTRSMLKEYRKLLDQYGLSHLKIWIEEWNSTLWQRDLSGDTCYKAAWLAKNICENYDEIESFGYWTLSDFIEERSDFGSVYHGGYGLFTYNGIPKSGWMALRLLRMLGDTKVDSGDGWLVTRSEQGIQIILSHYCHYDSLYCLQYQRLTEPQRAYSVFIKRGELKFEIQLTNLPEGKYEIKRYLISPEHGSSFDVWVNMGMPQYLRNEETEYLKRAAQPQYQVKIADLRNSFTVESQLAPHEVEIILLNTNDQFDIL